MRLSSFESQHIQSLIEGNEMDSFAKSAMRKEQITMGLMCTKAEIISTVYSSQK